MENKTIYYIIGGVAVLGIGYYFYNKSKSANSDSKNTEDTQSGNVLKEENLAEQKIANEKTEEVKIANEKIAEGKVAEAIATKFNATKRPLFFTEKLNLATATSATPFKGLMALKGNKESCGKKYGGIKGGRNFFDCLKRVEEGGIAFTGGNMDSDMFASFDNNLDLNL